MAKIYEWGNNPIRDFLLQIMLFEKNITDTNIKDGINGNISFLLKRMNVNEYNMQYLDYTLKETKKGYVRVVPNNIVCAMWFIGALPPNCDNIIKKNSVYFNGKKYKFNKRTKRLTWIKAKK